MFVNKVSYSESFWFPIHYPPVLHGPIPCLHFTWYPYYGFLIPEFTIPCFPFSITWLQLAYSHIFHPPSSDAVIPHSIWSSGSYTSSNSLFVPLPLHFHASCTSCLPHFLFALLPVSHTSRFPQFPDSPINRLPDSLAPRYRKLLQF